MSDSKRLLRFCAGTASLWMSDHYCIVSYKGLDDQRRPSQMPQPVKSLLNASAKLGLDLSQNLSVARDFLYGLITPLVFELKVSRYSSFLWKLGLPRVFVALEYEPLSTPFSQERVS